MTSPSSPLPIGDEAHNNVSPENIAVDTISEAWEILKANGVVLSEAGEDYLRVSLNKDGKETKMAKAKAATTKVVISNSEATDVEAISQNDGTENLNYRAKVIQAELASLTLYREELNDRLVAVDKDIEAAEKDGKEPGRAEKRRKKRQKQKEEKAAKKASKETEKDGQETENAAHDKVSPALKVIGEALEKFYVKATGEESSEADKRNVKRGKQREDLLQNIVDSTKVLREEIIAANTLHDEETVASTERKEKKHGEEMAKATELVISSSETEAEKKHGEETEKATELVISSSEVKAGKKDVEETGKDAQLVISSSETVTENKDGEETEEAAELVISSSETETDKKYSEEMEKVAELVISSPEAETEKKDGEETEKVSELAISSEAEAVEVIGKKKVKMPSGNATTEAFASAEGSSIFNENKTLTLKPSPSVGYNLESHMNVLELEDNSSLSSMSMMDDAWERLRMSYVYFKSKPIGTLAALDVSVDALNYNQVFVRDFVPSALASLMKNPAEPEIVRNFLLKTLHLQGWEKTIDNYTLPKGVMPASFKVQYSKDKEKDTLTADFGESAIGRVAPVDSGFWWIILLMSYTKSTRDHTLSELPEVQRGMKLILNLCLSDGFDTFPTLLCADGCSMIDRQMGIYGYPIEIQSLFFFALRCAKFMLKQENDGKELISRIDKRIIALSYHIQNYYWLDFTQLNNIYRYKTEEYSHTAVNKFNVIPDSIPKWVFEFMPLKGGYFIGNVSPARMDFRWFLVGNCISILSSLATPTQATAIMDLIEERWTELIGEMPLKIVYPALEGDEWRTTTGWDPKNTRWSYHNGGSWPVLIWMVTAACIKTGRPQIAKRAIELLEQRLAKDGWPEYYDGKTGRYIGKQARKYQTWSIAGYLVAKLMIEDPSNLLFISLEEDKSIAKPKISRSSSVPLP